MARPTLLPALLAITAACGGGRAIDPATEFPAYPPGPLPCAGAPAAFAPDHLLVGYAGDVAAVGGTGFDLRYQYLAGVLAPDPGCLDPARADARGCGAEWWGTWQWDALPPGQYVGNFVRDTTAAGLTPMITYYLLYPAARRLLGIAEGAPELTVAARDGAFMKAYLDDLRFFLRRLGATPAIVHLEPDLWGYAQQLARAAATDAHGLPAAVASANPEDCAAEADTVAGLGRCMIAMVRKHAPNALVALHGSDWAAGYACIYNRVASVDVADQARQAADFLAQCGAAATDLVVVDIGDRDAGWYARQSPPRDAWLDATDRTLPSFTQAFAWSRALTARLGKPGLWWQVPVGNPYLQNAAWTTADGQRAGAWQDNKLDYFFDHPDRVAASGAVGMAFGSGGDWQTTPSTDGGRLVARARALAAAGRQPLCRGP